MIPTRHRWPKTFGPQQEEIISERCEYCGAIRFRYRGGGYTRPGEPCDWSGIKDKAILQKIIDASITFFTIGPKPQKLYKPAKKAVQASVLLAALFFTSCYPPRHYGRWEVGHRMMAKYRNPCKIYYKTFKQNTMNNTKTFDIEASKAAQKKLQQEKGWPDFAPASGICYDCKRQIYAELETGYGKTGISLERASSELITGCPHCHHSYCE